MRTFLAHFLLWAGWLIFTTALCSCGGTDPPHDAGPPDGDAEADDGDVDEDGEDTGSPLCSGDDDCHDGVFCNGAERCRPGDEESDARGCRPGGGDPCLEGQVCSEDQDRCLTQCEVNPDADGDGSDAIACGGDDCDDADPDRFPGNAEVCDEEGHDEDCNHRTLGGEDDSDRDGDGYVSDRCCNIQPNGENLCGRDCDDTMTGINPGTPESCNGVDDDCDGIIDEDVVETRYYPDGDGDLYGDPEGEPVLGCAPPEGYVSNNTDCDDDEPRRHPGATEVCDDIPDNDCNEDTHPFDQDGDGYDMAGCGGTDCDDDDPDINPGAPEICGDGVDQNCDGVDGYSHDRDCDGYEAIEHGGDDCDDTDPEIHPGAVERCNGRDDDCDGVADSDGDGFVTDEACGGGDCDDEDPGVNPGAVELCADGIDQNCDGVIDDRPCWVVVPAGTFTMGSPAEESEREGDETEHDVTLTRDFLLLSTEVTQCEFEALMGYNPSHFDDCAECPVETVSWHEAAAYCNALSDRRELDQCYTCTGSEDSADCELNEAYSTPYQCPGFRLPTEAEWEYAARSGTTGARYGDVEDVAWYGGNSDGETHTVGALSPSSWGLYDMLGNVSEWCHDWYGEYPSGPVTDQLESEGDTGRRVVRGGFYIHRAQDVRAAKRSQRTPTSPARGIGFRPSRTAPRPMS